MDAVVLSIGTELVDGHLTDTNATFLAQELAALGVRLRWSAQVGDELESIVRILRRAWEDASLIVTTGGIGPTEDDLTREAIAALLDEPLSVDPSLDEEIRAFFAARGLVMPERNVKQAYRIPSCEPLPNPIGTAPGWFVRRDQHIIVSMPGVPREMTRMWREQAVPRLLPLLGGGVIRFRTLKTIGIGESLVEERLRDLVERGTPRIATYAKEDGVHVRISAQAEDEATAQLLLATTEQEIRSRLGDHIYGTDDTTLGGAILALLAQVNWHLALIEYGNGGRLATLLAEEPLAATHLERVVVHPRSPADGPPSSEQARRAAEAVRQETGAECAAALIVALDAGETVDRSPGRAAFALLTPRGNYESSYALVTHPQEFRRRATLWAAECFLAGLRRATAPLPESSATSV